MTRKTIIKISEEINDIEIKKVENTKKFIDKSHLKLRAIFFFFFVFLLRGGKPSSSQGTEVFCLYNLFQ